MIWLKSLREITDRFHQVEVLTQQNRQAEVCAVLVPDRYFKRLNVADRVDRVLGLNGVDWVTWWRRAGLVRR